MRTYASPALLLLIASCGTVVGNPKKPKGGDTPAPVAMVYALPELDFAVPPDAAADDAALKLTGDPDLSARGDKVVLKAWARRVDKLIKQVNAATRRVNAIASAKKTEADGTGVLHFTDQGGDGELAGRIGPVVPASGFAYEAVICHASAPWLHFKWSADGRTVSLTRNFAAKADVADETDSYLSQIVATSTDTGLTLDVRTQGQDVRQSGDDGSGITERSRILRSSDGTITVASTADRYASAPGDGNFAGDSYLVARLSPRGDGGKHFDQEFVGYTKANTALCRSGFDEEASDLWDPDRVGPRFCLGRPRGAATFPNLAAFRDTAAGLKAVGIVKKSELSNVVFDASVSCGTL